MNPELDMLITDHLSSDNSCNSIPSPVDVDSLNMPPPRISPTDTHSEGRPLRRPRSDSSGYLTRSGNLTSRQSFEGYPSIQTRSPPNLALDIPNTGAGRSPGGPQAAMFISPAFRSMAQGWDPDLREQSESPARTATPSEDVFSLDWDSRSGMPDPPSKQPPPSPKPQSYRWTAEHEAETRRRKLHEGTDGEDPEEELGSQVGRFTVSHRMDLDDHVSLPSQFTTAPPSAIAQPRRRPSPPVKCRRPSTSLPSSPIKSEELNWLSRCPNDLAPLSLEDLQTAQPAVAPNPSNNPYRSTQWNDAQCQNITKFLPPPSPGPSPCSSPGSRPGVISTIQRHASKFREQFHELGSVYAGPSSQVFWCRGKLDQWMYVVKRSANKISQGSTETQLKQDLNEVYALSSLSGHPRFVRHFSCWIDNDAHLYTQLELCCGGSLAEQVAAGQHYNEPQLLQVLHQAASGLEYLHAQDLTHRSIGSHSLFVTGLDSCGAPKIKIGHLRLLGRFSRELSGIDWTHPAQARSLPYVSPEAVRPGMPAHMWPRCDTFALGMTLLDQCSPQSLPQELEDPEWSSLRQGTLPQCRPEFTPEFMLLIQQLLQHQFDSRQILQHPLVCSSQAIDKDNPAESFATRLLLTRVLEAEVDRREGVCNHLARELKLRAEFESLLRQYITEREGHLETL